VGTLTGSSGGQTVLNGANKIVVLGPFSAGTALDINDTVNLTITGPLHWGGGGVDIVAPNGGYQ
jgi:hypothetical protein